MSKKLAVAVDLGGTSVKMGLVDSDGRMSRVERFATSKSGAADVADLIIRQALTMIASVGKSAIKGIGVGTAGDVDPHTGVIRISPNLNWHNVPLKQMLRRKLKFPIRVENDANVAAWAAHVVEAKRQINDLICITLGTGIGGGIVLGGKLYRGATGSAGEIGHMTLYPDGVPCNCGNHGCLERYVAARAMTDEARRAIEAGTRTLIKTLVGPDLSRLEPAIIQAAARRGDKLAITLWKQTGVHLGIGLASMINLLNPEWVVLAGGLSRAGNLLLTPVKQTILARAFATPAKKAKLVISKLDQDLGIVGAGLVAHDINP